MEALVDSGLLSAVIDITTTEIADLLFGGVLPRETRSPRLHRAHAGSRMSARSAPATWSISGRRDTMPAAAQGPDASTEHNANVTLMRTTADECRAIGEWIAAKLNACDGPVRFLIPEKGVSALDIEGGAFWDPGCGRCSFRRHRHHGAIGPNGASSSASRFTSTTRHSPRRRSPPSPRSSPRRPDLPAIPRAEILQANSSDGGRETPDRRRRRGHGPFGQVRRSGRHRSHHHLQFRPLSHGRPRLGRGPAGLWQCQ